MDSSLQGSMAGDIIGSKGEQFFCSTTACCASLEQVLSQPQVVNMETRVTCVIRAVQAWFGERFAV